VRHGIYVLALGVTILVSTRPAHAAPGTSIVLDGSLGPGGLVPSSSPGFYAITPAMGKTVGPNLFQSLGTFNLGTGDTADFVTTADTQKRRDALPYQSGGNHLHGQRASEPRREHGPHHRQCGAPE
jgi:hypothetical protein